MVLVYKMAANIAVNSVVKRGNKYFSSRRMRKWYPRKKWRRPQNGYFVIKRRVPMFNVYSTGSTTLPNIITNNPTVFKVGSVVAAANNLSGWYDVPFALEFHLNDLQDYTDITSICDRYKILRADIVCQNTLNAGGTPAVPTFIQYVHDWDDSGAPTINFLNTKMGMKNKGFNSLGQLKMRTYPKVAQAVFNNGIPGTSISTAQVASKAVYLDAAYPEIPHFGLKGVIRNVYGTPSTSAAGSITFDLVLTVACKDLQ